MNAGHFAYLLAGQPPSRVKLAADQLEILAKTAAKRYVEEGVRLNDSISKLAKQNELNPAQIERVCEMANIATHQALWPKTAQKESIAFPLANSKVVIASCGCGGDPMPPVNGNVDSDYAGPPKGIPLAGGSLASMMGVDPSAVHNGLAGPNEGQRIVIVLQKRAAERQAMVDRILVNGMQLEDMEKQAYHHVKQTVLGGASFRQVYEAAVGAGFGKMAEEYLPGFEDRLRKESHGRDHLRLEKQAIGKAPSDLISDSLGNTCIINGAHPVLVSLDTIQAKTGEIRNGLWNLLRIDDEIKVYQQKIRELG